MARISSNQLIKLQRRFKTDEAIARLYGISRQAVHQLRDRYRIPPVRDKYVERNRLLVRDYTDGANVPTISRRFRLSVPQVYRIIKHAAGGSVRLLPREARNNPRKPVRK